MVLRTTGVQLLYQASINHPCIRVGSPRAAPPSIHTLDDSFSSLQQVIDSPVSWLVMYGAAGIGWVLYFCVPPIVAMVVEVRVDETKRRLEGRAKVLVEEWGEEVTGRKS